MTGYVEEFSKVDKDSLATMKKQHIFTNWFNQIIWH